MTQARFIAICAPLAQLAQQRKQRQAQDCEVVALDALEQLHAEPFELVGADRLADASPARRRYSSRNASEKSRMVRRAVCDVAPRHRRRARASATAECSSCVRPLSCQQACARSHRHRAGFRQDLVAERQHLVGADDERAVVLSAHVLRLGARRGSAATCSGPASPVFASSRRIAGSSTSAGSTVKATPAAASISRRAALADASTIW